MKVALRTLTAVSIGLFVALVLLVAVEFFSAVVHPLPEDFGGTTEEMCRHVGDTPMGTGRGRPRLGFHGSHQHMDGARLGT